MDSKGAYETVQDILDSYAISNLPMPTEVAAQQIVDALMEIGWVHSAWGPEENRIAWKKLQEELRDGNE